MTNREPVNGLNGITVQMACPEYLRLHQHYDAALRRWAQSELSSHRPGLIDASARLAEVVRQKALDGERKPYGGCVFMSRIVPPATRGANLVADRTSATAVRSDPEVRQPGVGITFEDAAA